MTLDELMSLPPHMTFYGISRCMYMKTIPGTSIAGWEYRLAADIGNPPTYTATNGKVYRLSTLYKIARGETIEAAKAAAIKLFLDAIPIEERNIEGNIRNQMKVASTPSAIKEVQLTLDDLEL